MVKHHEDQLSESASPYLGPDASAFRNGMRQVRKLVGGGPEVYAAVSHQTFPTGLAFCVGASLDGLSKVIEDLAGAQVDDSVNGAVVDEVDRTYTAIIPGKVGGLVVARVQLPGSEDQSASTVGQLEFYRYLTNVDSDVPWPSPHHFVDWKFDGPPDVRPVNVDQRRKRTKETLQELAIRMGPPPHGLVVVPMRDRYFATIGAAELAKAQGTLDESLQIEDHLGALVIHQWFCRQVAGYVDQQFPDPQLTPA